MYPFFSRSGDEILYTIQESPDETAVFAKPADGFGQPHTVPAPEGFKVAQDRSADGQYLAVVGRPRDGKIINMWLWRNDGRGGNGEAIHYSRNSENEHAVTVSPNGHYAAYTSTISGRLEVYVRPFPEGDGRWQVSVNGGQAPVWRPDGSELFFSEDTTLMASSASTSGLFSASAPNPLFEHPLLRVGAAPAARYAVTRDGQRFLTVESERDRERPVVRVVQNWFSEFSRAAPTSKE
jgi:Tol biopolymer transport system component